MGSSASAAAARSTPQGGGARHADHARGCGRPTAAHRRADDAVGRGVHGHRRGDRRSFARQARLVRPAPGAGRRHHRSRADDGDPGLAVGVDRHPGAGPRRRINLFGAAPPVQRRARLGGDRPADRPPARLTAPRRTGRAGARGQCQLAAWQSVFGISTRFRAVARVRASDWTTLERAATGSRPV